MSEYIFLIAFTLFYYFTSIVGTLVLFYLMYEDSKDKTSIKKRAKNDAKSDNGTKENMIGILSPSGTFYTCGPEEHRILAEKLCERIYYKIKTDAFAEDYLLVNGFIFIKKNSAYMSRLDGLGNARILTSQQLWWIQNNIGKTEDVVKKDLTEIVLDNEKRIKWGIKPFDSENRSSF